MNVRIKWIPLFFVSTGVWTQDCMLARQELYHLDHTPALFCISLCLRESQELLPWASVGSCSSYLCLLNSWDYSCVPRQLAKWIFLWNKSSHSALRWGTTLLVLLASLSDFLSHSSLAARLKSEPYKTAVYCGSSGLLANSYNFRHYIWQNRHNVYWNDLTVHAITSTVL
jgi:hypothetical protein